MIGLGLLEAVPLSTLEALADPDDADGDGISGRINRLTDHFGKAAAGRFGWKANVASLARTDGRRGGRRHRPDHQPLSRARTARPNRRACLAPAAEPDPEISDMFLDRLVNYASTLAVPDRARPRQPGSRQAG